MQAWWVLVGVRPRDGPLKWEEAFDLLWVCVLDFLAMEVSSDAFPPDDTVARAIKDITFGSIAGMVSKVFEHPFDLTKVRLQSQVLDSTARFDGPMDCLKQTFRNEGISGLYRVYHLI